MKNLLLSILFLSAFSFAGCFEDVIAIKVPAGYAAAFTIKGPIEAGIKAEALSSKIITESEDFKKLNVTVDNVESAKLSELTLTIFPEGRDFSELVSAEFFMVDANQNTILVAQITEDMPKNVNTMTLQLYDEDLAPFIKTGEVYLAAYIITNKRIEEDITMVADLKCDIKVKP